MSNEELVAEIQAGAEERMSELWEQVERLVKWKANRIMTVLEDWPGRGVEFEDLYQSGYLAMVAAANTYDPTAGGSFSTWFMFYLKKAFDKATGNQTLTQRNDPIHTAISLDCPLTDETDSRLLSEVIPDPTSTIHMQNVEDQVYQQQLHNALEMALNELPATQQDILRKRYFEGESVAQLSNNIGITVDAVRQIERNGLRRLRHPTTARLLMPFYNFDYYSFSTFGVFKNSGLSVQERYLIDMEKFQKS